MKGKLNTTVDIEFFSGKGSLYLYPLRSLAH